jgi:dCMP deaminase
MTSKKTNYISWDTTFMSTAIVIAKRSKDPSTQVGACIVNDENHVVGLGYNGFPRGCSDDDFSWGKDDPDDNKYLYVVHAEENAILNSIKGSLKGCNLYVTMFPCNKCSQSIIQKGISKIIYLNDKYHDKPEYIASRKMLDSSHVEYIKFDGDLSIDINVKKR